MTLSDCNHLAHVIVLLLSKYKNLYAPVPFLYLRAISKYKPTGAYIRRGNLSYRVFFELRVWGGLYLEGLIHGGAYFSNFTVCHSSRRVIRLLEYI